MKDIRDELRDVELDKLLNDLRGDLRAAASCDDVEAGKIILDQMPRGGVVNYFWVFKAAIENDSRNFIRLMLDRASVYNIDINCRDGGNFTPLLEAARCVRCEIIGMLIDAGARDIYKIKHDNINALYLLMSNSPVANEESAAEVHKAAIKLIDSGSDINNIGAGQYSNLTILEHSIISFYEETAAYLLDKGVTLEAGDYDGYSVLAQAIVYLSQNNTGGLTVIRKIVERGHPINIEEIICAIRRGTKPLEILLEYKPAINGCLAEASKYPEVYELLKKYVLDNY